MQSNSSAFSAPAGFSGQSREEEAQKSAVPAESERLEVNGLETRQGFYRVFDTRLVKVVFTSRRGWSWTPHE